MYFIDLWIHKVLQKTRNLFTAEQLWETQHSIIDKLVGVDD